MRWWIQKPAELGGSMATVAFTNHLARLHIQGGE
jgi:hypothetical protein